MGQRDTSSDGYDFFAPARTSSGAGYGSAPNPQFGTTPDAPGVAAAGPAPWSAPIGAPPLPPQRPARRGWRRPWVFVLLGIVGALVLLFTVVLLGLNAMHTKPVVIPTTMGGVGKATDPELTAGFDSAMLGAQHPDWASGAAMYGDKSGVLILFVGRGPVQVEREFSDFQAASGITLTVPVTTSSEATCRADATGSITYCVRTSMFLTVEVASVKGPMPADTALDAVWDLQ